MALRGIPEHLPLVQLVRFGWGLGRGLNRLGTLV